MLPHCPTFLADTATRPALEKLAAPSSNVPDVPEKKEADLTVIIVIVVAVAITAAAAFFFMRGRKDGATRMEEKDFSEDWGRVQQAPGAI